MEKVVKVKDIEDVVCFINKNSRRDNLVAVLKGNTIAIEKVRTEISI